MTLKRFGFGRFASLAVLGGALIGFTAGAARAQSGSTMFQHYCASCHGIDGTGDGPVAASLKIKPANLTILSKHNGGIFPARQVHDYIDGTKAIAAHGPREMPVWGRTFALRESAAPVEGFGGLPPAAAGNYTSARTPQEIHRRIGLLVDYLKSIQR
jgi:mono/diheme cytochrome c family protein